MNYSDFVRSRVKWMPTENQDLHHAATGIMGEVVELHRAIDRENFLEEAGDIEFYFEHFQQAFGRDYADFEHDTDYKRIQIVRPMEALIDGAGGLLDLTKKLWIYEKPIAELRNKICYQLLSIRIALHNIYAMHAVTLHDLQALNRQKLEKRYPNGYSNQAAQQRADKPQGE